MDKTVSKAYSRKYSICSGIDKRVVFRSIFKEKYMGDCFFSFFSEKPINIYFSVFVFI